MNFPRIFDVYSNQVGDFVVFLENLDHSYLYSNEIYMLFIFRIHFFLMSYPKCLKNEKGETIKKKMYSENEWPVVRIFVFRPNTNIN